MSASLDMSLDDIIRNKTRSEGHSRHSRRRPRVSGPGPDRRPPIRDQPRTNPYPVRPQMPMLPVEVPAWQAQVIPTGGSEVEAKLYISNLDYGVSNEDIKVLFSEVGELKRYSINYDKSGRSKGTAEVVFFSQREALAAIKRYNNLQLDGKPMRIELVGANVVMSPSVPPAIPSTQRGILRTPNMAPRRDQERTGGRGWVHGGVGGSNGPNLGGVSRRFAEGRGAGGGFAGGGFAGGRGAGGGFAGGRGAGGGRPSGKKLSAEDLDADLDNYHLEATRIK